MTPPTDSGGAAPRSNANAHSSHDGDDRHTTTGDDKRRVELLLSAVDQENVADFVRLFMPRPLDDASLSDARQAEITQWMERHLSNPAALGLAEHPLGTFTPGVEPQTYFLRWRWPRASAVESVVAVIFDSDSLPDSHPDAVLEKAEQGHKSIFFAEEISRRTLRESFSQVSVSASLPWKAAKVYLWSIVDSQIYRRQRGKRFTSSPLVLLDVPERADCPGRDRLRIFLSTWLEPLFYTRWS